MFIICIHISNMYLRLHFVVTRIQRRRTVLHRLCQPISLSDSLREVELRDEAGSSLLSRAYKLAGDGNAEERLVRCRVRDIAVTLHLDRLIGARLCVSINNGEEKREKALIVYHKF